MTKVTYSATYHDDGSIAHKIWRNEEGLLHNEFGPAFTARSCFVDIESMSCYDKTEPFLDNSKMVIGFKAYPKDVDDALGPNKHYTGEFWFLDGILIANNCKKFGEFVAFARLTEEEQVIVKLLS